MVSAGNIGTPPIPALTPIITTALGRALGLDTFQSMLQACSRAVSLATGGAFAFLMTAALCAQAPTPRPVECKPVPGVLAAIDVLSAFNVLSAFDVLSATDPQTLACLTQSKRVELLTRPLAPAVLAPLGRDYRLHSALHQLKAREAEALANADPSTRHPLAAYLDGRAIESMRSQALMDTEREIVRSQSRILFLGIELKAATQAATDWLHRQPGRDLPAAYRQRIVRVAAAILAEDDLLALRNAERDEVNRVFDGELYRVLTLQG